MAEKKRHLRNHNPHKSRKNMFIGEDQMAMKVIRRLLVGILGVVLLGTIGLVGWATLSAQEATTAAVAVLQANRQYADYSFQRDDGIATISAAEQQEQIVAATVQFLDALE
jgi:hypothetical protein